MKLCAGHLWFILLQCSPYDSTVEDGVQLVGDNDLGHSKLSLNVLSRHLHLLKEKNLNDILQGNENIDIVKEPAYAQ